MEIRSGIGLFNKLNGRLRISLTHNCQLHCLFCHQEAIEDHWKPVYMQVEFFRKLLGSFKKLGGKEINLTGGEPTLHPDIENYINIAADNSYKLALCTNGLRLDRVFNVLDKIDQVKLSVHDTDTITGKVLLGKAYNYPKIEKNILKALDLGANITVNFTHTGLNSGSFRDVINKVEEWQTNFLVIDLISTRWSGDLSTIGRIESFESEKILKEYAELVDIVEDRTGCVMKVFKSRNGKTWMVKDANFGRLFSSMCTGCGVRATCGEGLFVMRVDCHGNFKPCLLRPDLEKKIDPFKSSADQVLAHMIEVGDLMFPDDSFEYD